MLIKKTGIYVMAALYLLAGINHFIHPDNYISIIPAWLPWKKTLNIIAGVCEIIFSILLLPASTRKIAAWLIIILLIAVFPANIQMTVNYYKTNNPLLWLTILRLPLQFLLIWWAWLYIKNGKKHINAAG